MGVLELTLLHLKPPTTPQDPLLLHNLRTIRTALQTNSCFFVSTPESKEPTELFILGLWPNLQAHHDFLASPRRDEVLGPQEGQTSFQWGVHFDGVDKMEDLPLNGEQLVISRWNVNAGSKQAEMLDEAVRHVARIGDNRLFFRERIDAEGGLREFFLLFSDLATISDNASRVLHELTNTLPPDINWHLKDLEKVNANK